MDSCRVLLLAAVLVVPAACQDTTVLISQNPCVVGKLISIDIGDSYDDLNVCRLKKSSIIDMVTTTTIAPDTTTFQTNKGHDLTVKFTPEVELKKIVTRNDQVTRAKQEILDELRQNVKLAQQRLNPSEQSRGQCEKFVFTRQQNSSGLWDDSSEWQTGTHDEYLRYLKSTGQLTQEESTPWDPQVTTYVDGDPQNWELPKATSRKLDPPPQSKEKPAPEVENPKQSKTRGRNSKSDSESEEAGLVTRSTEQKWDSWVEQQLEAYLGHLKGGQPKQTSPVQMRNGQTPKQKVAKKADKRNRNEDDIEDYKIRMKGRKRKNSKNRHQSEEVDKKQQPDSNKKSSSVAVRQDDVKDEPWLKTMVPKKIGQGKKRWQQFRTAKGGNRKKAKVGQRMTKNRSNHHEKKSAKRKCACQESKLVNEEQEQFKRENLPAPREENQKTVQDHDLIPAWKIRRLIELIGVRQREAEVADSSAEPWRSLSLQNEGSAGGKRKIIFKNVDTNQGVDRRSLFGHKRYWFKKGGRKKHNKG